MDQYSFRFGENYIHEINDIMLQGNQLFLPNKVIEDLTDNNNDIYLLPSENNNMFEICSADIIGYVEKEIEHISCDNNSGRVVRRFYMSRLICVELNDKYSIELPDTYIHLLLGDYMRKIKIESVKLSLGYREMGDTGKYIYSVWLQNLNKLLNC